MEHRPSISAPVDGTVGVRTLRVGQYVQAGTQLMAVVPLQAAYVVANYKETQLTDVRPGQPVTICPAAAARIPGRSRVRGYRSLGETQRTRRCGAPSGATDSRSESPKQCGHGGGSDQ
jgi:multidrug efflux pump subunit AcrA (membrane-fusion protein)